VNDAAIVIEGLCKRFGENRALDGLGFTVRRGSLCAILGHNGAGKTTTIRVLLGLVAPDAGVVRVLGRDPFREGREIRARVGVLLDSDGLYDRMSAEANLRFHGRIHGLSTAACDKAIDDGLRRFDLWDRRRERVAGWSTGMRKKLALARTLLHQPTLLLLDEPFAGLDPIAAADLRGFLARLAKDESLTTVMTTHDLAHVERSCDHVIVVEHGRVLAEGSLADLQRHAVEITIVVRGEGITSELLERMRSDGIISHYETIERGVSVRSSDSDTRRLAAELIGAGVKLEELHKVESSLEDVFISLAGKNGAA
jgi:ABC-2 type transport system ATP-binding protein